MGKSTKGTGKISVDCETCQARPDGLCEGFAPEVLGRIASHKSGDRKVTAGEDIFGLGEPCDEIYNLVEGWVFLYNILQDGRRQILHFALPGAILGFHSVGGAKATFAAQALTDSIVCVIPHKALRPMSRECPEIGLRLAGRIARDRNLAYDHLTSIGRHSARERVAHLILELFIRFRSQWPGQNIEEMYLPLTQEHIGDATGLTGVHVNRVIRDLRQEGVLEFHYRRLKILNPDKLVDIADIDPQLAQSWTGSPLPD
tara:strand:+ start:2280 stop:3053 length:774 start_codon:yes stop_codon:yes gene_type:complete